VLAFAQKEKRTSFARNQHHQAHPLVALQHLAARLGAAAAAAGLVVVTAAAAGIASRRGRRRFLCRRAGRFGRFRRLLLLLLLRLLAAGVLIVGRRRRRRFDKALEAFLALFGRPKIGLCALEMLFFLLCVRVRRSVRAACCCCCCCGSHTPTLASALPSPINHVDHRHPMSKLLLQQANKANQKRRSPHHFLTSDL
jgi:hypothetical protein